MADLACFNSFCEKPAEYQCDCSAPQTFWCQSHLINHLEVSNSNHLVETITKNTNISIESFLQLQINPSNENLIEHPFECPHEHLCDCPCKPNNHNEYIYDHSSECPFNSQYEYLHKTHNQAIQSILDLISSQKLAIERIKPTFSNTDFFSLNPASGLIKASLNSINQYSEVLDETKLWAECAISIDDIPFSLMEIMNIADNITIQIEFLEILKEVLLIKNKVKYCWLEKLSKNMQKIDSLKCEINTKIQYVKNWCYEHKKNKDSLKSIDDKKIDILSNEMKLISEFVNGKFEPSYNFQIEGEKLLIYGVEDRGWCKIKLSVKQCSFALYEAQAIELPNREIFCLGADNSCIIDLDTLTVKQAFPASKGDIYSALIYYENCVYAFNTNNFEKFDIIKRRKSILPNRIANYWSDISCCIYKSSILVCAESTRKLCKFDLLIENFSDIPFYHLSPKSGKMIFTGNMRAYIVDDKNGIFESEIDNDYIWNKIGEFEINFASNDSISYLNCVYFSSRSLNIFKEDHLPKCRNLMLYQFDLSSKKLFKMDYYSFGSVGIEIPLKEVSSCLINKKIFNN